jgi:hypothetical protein
MRVMGSRKREDPSTVPAVVVSRAEEPGESERLPRVQGYLAHKNLLPPRTIQYDYAEGPMVVLGGLAVSYERGTPVQVDHND